MIQEFSPFLVGISLYGAYAITVTKMARWGFLAWIVADLGWAVLFAIQQQWSPCFLFVVYTVLAVKGWRSAEDVKMMCYKDKTFCKFDDCQKWNGCSRAYTNEIEISAGNWWKSGGGDPKDAPVCFYADMPLCHSDNVQE